MGYGHDGDTLWFHSNLVAVPPLRPWRLRLDEYRHGQRLGQELPQSIVGYFYEAPSGASPKRFGPYIGRGRPLRRHLPANRRAFSGLEKFFWLMIGQSWID